MFRPRWPALLLAVASVLPLAGCWWSSGDEADAEFRLGDLIDASFKPPTLAELDAQVNWVEQPVLDSLHLLREKLEQEASSITADEALKLRNDSPEANARILGALGRQPTSDGEVDWDATILRHNSADVGSTNPLLYSSVYDGYVQSLTSFGLFSFDWQLNRFAAAESVVSWHTSDDLMYDKIVLRDDLTWSDGAPITAHDVVFSWKAIMSSQVPTPAMRTGMDDLKWIEAYDDRTLVFFHKKPLATNSVNISFSIIPKHVYAQSIAEDPSLTDSDYHVRLENKPISGGAYQIVRRQRGQEIVLARRESYYMHKGKQVRDKPYFRTVRFRVLTEPSVALLQLKAGDLDEMQLTAEQWNTQTGGDDFYRNNTKAMGVEWTSFHFGWNNQTPYFSDRRVRQAMSYAFDHEEMLQRLRYGLDQPCNGVFHPTSIWAPKDAAPPYQRDLNKAQQLLEEAGWIDSDRDGIRDKTIGGRKVDFEFTVLVTDRPDRIAICNLLRESLAHLGIRCHVRSLEFTVMQQQLLKHEFQACFGGWGTGADPDTLENIFGTREERNFVNYTNAKVDELFQAGKREFDRAKRAEIYGQIHKLLYEDQPYTWLFYQNSYYAFSKKLRGYHFSPRGPYSYGPGISAIWKPVLMD